MLRKEGETILYMSIIANARLKSTGELENKDRHRLNVIYNFCSAYYAFFFHSYIYNLKN